MKKQSLNFCCWYSCPLKLPPTIFTPCCLPKKQLSIYIYIYSLHCLSQNIMEIRLCKSCEGYNLAGSRIFNSFKWTHSQSSIHNHSTIHQTVIPRKKQNIAGIKSVSPEQILNSSITCSLKHRLGSCESLLFTIQSCDIIYWSPTALAMELFVVSSWNSKECVLVVSWTRTGTALDILAPWVR